MSYQDHVRFEECPSIPTDQQKTVEVLSEYPEVPDGDPDAYSIVVTEEGEIRIIDRSRRHGEKFIICSEETYPETLLPREIVVACHWKPPEKRSEVELITCPWQKPWE